MSETTVRRVWRNHGLKPHRIESFKVSRDPKFVEKLEDVVGLYLRLLATREPVSQVVGMGPEQAVFLFNEGRRPLWYCEELDCLLCLEEEGDLLRLFDVVAPRLPDWEQLWSRLPGTCRQVELAFAPDRFCPHAQAVPRLFEHDGPSWLMLRGDWVQGPFTLPRPART